MRDSLTENLNYQLYVCISVVVPGDRHSRDEAVHETVFWQLRVEISADLGEVRGQTAEEQNVCPCCQSAIVKETFNPRLHKFHSNTEATRQA